MSKSKDNSKRQRILQAATKVFAQKGFALSKISEIAKEAGVADGTIYLYFRNKDDLLVAAFEYNLDFLIPMVREALAVNGDPVEQLRIFIETHLKLIGQNKEFSRVFQVELQQSHQFMHELNNCKIQDYLMILTEVIESGQKQGLLRDDLSPAIIRRVLFGALADFALYRAIETESGNGQEFNLQESAEQVYQIIVGGLRDPQALPHPGEPNAKNFLSKRPASVA